MPRAAPVTTATGSCPLRVGWANSSLLTGDLKEELAKLKKRDGKNILIPGSPTLVRSLLRDRLLDELALNIMPAVVGSGMRLFEGIGGRVPLELVESKTFGTGAVGVTYRPAAEVGEVGVFDQGCTTGRPNGVAGLFGLPQPASDHPRIFQLEPSVSAYSGTLKGTQKRWWRCP
jgi:hypothetical protein